ncbi:MAG: aminodeoxychorismate synthase component I [Hymenobacteraceae bacterium]|nr:aminodeoxychorismate synthase component I [Hymenobacteraceae bacterium]MDX5395987.1 aminodeoxychorismate synthase component I [Hymenobacteraceae bacterium]MDX5512050.1 aminodeoxychorismate synthase component I [Hymenobacteraceae bacterium]
MIENSYPYRLTIPVSAAEKAIFKQQALQWAQQFEQCLYLENNGLEYPQQPFRNLLGVRQDAHNLVQLEQAFNSLQEALQEKKWLLGFLCYDLKNQVEELESQHPNHLNFPLMHFFEPEILLLFEKNEIIIQSKKDNCAEIIYEIKKQQISDKQLKNDIKLKQRVSREQYLHDVEAVRQHIVEGDVYELNYCMEFFVENAVVEPLQLFRQLSKMSPTPFAGFLKLQNKYLLCASPERFLKKEQQKLVSQPIKGTIRRGSTPAEDAQLRHQLRHDEKEQAENLMIVDLVRNDLARVSEIGSVKVDELFGIYPFQHVFQMISTISSQKRPEVTVAEILKATFPMGSMTGAPKIRAMQLIEQYEHSRRGLYSGSIGFISPEQDFDFNVVIRSIQYNAGTGYLSFTVGSAITYDSVPEQEYEECLLKAKAMFGVLGC